MFFRNMRIRNISITAAKVLACLIGVMFSLSGAMTVSGQLNAPYNSISHFKENYLKNARIVAPGVIDRNAALSLGTGVDSAPSSGDNVYVGGPVVNDFVKSLNSELGISINVRDSKVTGKNTEIELHALNQSKFVSGEDFGKYDYGVLSLGYDKSGKKYVVVEGLTRYGTEAGAKLISSQYLPYSDALFEWIDFNSDKKVDLDEIRVIEGKMREGLPPEPVKKQLITIDGKDDDWKALGIAPLATDSKGDNILPGADLEAVYAARDNESVYFLIKEFSANSVVYSDITVTKEMLNLNFKGKASQLLVREGKFNEVQLRDYGTRPPYKGYTTRGVKRNANVAEFEISISDFNYAGIDNIPELEITKTYSVNYDVQPVSASCLYIAPVFPVCYSNSDSLDVNKRIQKLG